MRIAFGSETWAPSVDGVVTRLRATVTELRRAGHEVLLIVPDGAGVREHPDGVRVVELPSVSSRFVSGGRIFGLPWRGPVERALREFRPDLVHVLSPYILGRAVLAAAESLELPVVTSFHQDLATAARHAGLGLLSGPIWAYLRHQHGSSDRTLVTSQAMAELLPRHRIEPVELWPFGVDLERFHPRRRDEAVRRALLGDHDRNDVVALYVGRLAPEKGLRRLYPLARARGVRLVLAGDGPMRNQLVEDLADTDTLFTGWLAGDELADLYASADVFTFPSNTETLGFVLIEALASGLPVLAADSAPTAEILGGSSGGAVVAEHDWGRAPQLIRSLLTPSRQTVSRAARRRSLNWDWTVATEALVDIYRAVLQVDRLRAPAAS
ncbi:glycosyltransferase family 4 protein [Microlunatus soli]|nr:glycosyltransferase family 1 protein [Microlunatus soli]